MAISMLKIRRPLGRLIFNMGIAIPGKTVFLIETAPEQRTLNKLSQRLWWGAAISMKDTKVIVQYVYVYLCIQDMKRYSRGYVSFITLFNTWIKILKASS